MKTRRRLAATSLVLLVIGGGWLGHAFAQNRGSARQRMIGAWQLESRTVRTATGEILLDPVLGRQPLGRLFYDASGQMMLQMMRQERAQAITEPSNPQDAKNPRIMLGYDAYFGTFTVNEARRTITHRVEARSSLKTWERTSSAPTRSRATPSR